MHGKRIRDFLAALNRLGKNRSKEREIFCFERKVTKKRLVKKNKKGHLNRLFKKAQIFPRQIDLAEKLFIATF